MIRIPLNGPGNEQNKHKIQKLTTESEIKQRRMWLAKIVS